MLNSCKDSNQINQNSSAVNISFEHVVGNQPLILENTTYTNALNENFTVSTFNYYISNIRLLHADGVEYIYPQEKSYFLVREENTNSKTIVLENIPAGSYRELIFTLGIDSAKSTGNHSEFEGTLDIIAHADMHWSWNAGYIFLKLEGNSPQAPVDAAGNQKFRYHIGGYKDVINNLKTVCLPFSNEMNITKNDPLSVCIEVDLAKIFDRESTISIAQNHNVQLVPFSINIANNYAGMFYMTE